MTVIANRVMPSRKHIVIALTGIYGIGISRARKICAATNIPEDLLVKDLTEEQLETLRRAVGSYEDIEG